MTDDEFWLQALKEYLQQYERTVGFMYQGSYRYVGIYWASTVKGRADLVPMWAIGANTDQVPPIAAKELLLSKQPTFDIEMFKLGKELTHG